MPVAGGRAGAGAALAAVVDVAGGGAAARRAPEPQAARNRLHMTTRERVGLTGASWHAARAADLPGSDKAFRPKVVIPYHYRDQSVAELGALLKGVKGVAMRSLDFYPGETN